MRRRWWVFSVALAAACVLLAFWSGTWKRADRQTQEHVSRANGIEPSSSAATAADEAAGVPDESKPGTSVVVVNDFDEPLAHAAAVTEDGSQRFDADESGRIRIQTDALVTIEAPVLSAS